MQVGHREVRDSGEKGFEVGNKQSLCFFNSQFVRVGSNDSCSEESLINLLIQMVPAFFTQREILRCAGRVIDEIA